MFKMKMDCTIEELTFNCTSCGEEQIGYTDITPMLHCIKCGGYLNPNPFRLFNSVVYRVRYHFMGIRKESNVDKTEN